jgi:uncharacterized BrkB/YihY/UPF0761 family membrane protein
LRVIVLRAERLGPEVRLLLLLLSLLLLLLLLLLLVVVVVVVRASMPLRRFGHHAPEPKLIASDTALPDPPVALLFFLSPTRRYTSSPSAATRTRPDHS